MEAHIMNHLTLALAELLAPLQTCFRVEVFTTFQAVVAAWLICPGPRTLSEVWQASSLAGKCHYDAIYSLFGAAQWSWDEIGALLCLLILTQLVPTGPVWIVIDDTLCHKRGAKVAFGGMFLDPVLSSKRRKVLRFGLNWVVLGIAVRLPCRPDRYYCLPVLWRVFRKKGLPGHQKKTVLAAELARRICASVPHRDVWLVADSAYVNARVLRDRPATLQVIGPLSKKAALYLPAPEPKRGQRGRRRRKGERLPTPAQMLEDTKRFAAAERTFAFPRGAKALRVQVVRDILWYTGCKTEPVAVVLVRDPAGQWRDEVLLCTSATAGAAAMLEGYARRWSVELSFFDSKQHRGLHDPQVWSERSVERAHPMAWFCYSVTLLWYARQGQTSAAVQRERPWYTPKHTPTFTQMLGALRLDVWRQRLFGEAQADAPGPPTQEMLETLLHCLAAVR
jgi:hypothetical protein